MNTKIFLPYNGGKTSHDGCTACLTYLWLFTMNRMPHLIIRNNGIFRQMLDTQHHIAVQTNIMGCL